MFVEAQQFNRGKDLVTSWKEASILTKVAYVAIAGPSVIVIGLTVAPFVAVGLTAQYFAERDLGKNTH